MSNSDFLTVTSFAKYARTTRDALRFYDNIGLLSPKLKTGNNYRYYSYTQVGSVNMIRILQDLGMSLSDIKKIKDHRNPDNTDELLSQQIDSIEEKLDDWSRARKLLLTLREIIREIKDIDENEITMQFVPAKAIVLGDINDYSRGRNDYDALMDFYKEAIKKYPDMDLNYPVWGLFSQQKVESGDFAWPDRYYFYNPEGRDKKPAATYVVGYTRGKYGDGADLFKRLLDYIDKNNLVMCADAYKEYPLNEVCISDENDYLIRVMIPVRKK